MVVAKNPEKIPVEWMCQKHSEVNNKQFGRCVCVYMCMLKVRVLRNLNEYMKNKMALKIREMKKQ